MTPVLAVLALLLFAAVSFFFALAESALFSLGKWQVRQITERSPRFGAKVTQLLTHPQDLLGTIVFGNTFANAFIIGCVLWMTFYHHWPMLLAMGGALLGILLGVEVIPKTLAVRAPEFWAARVAFPMLLFVKLTKPVRHVAQRINETLLSLVPKNIKPQFGITEEEYQELLEIACQQGTLAPTEKEIILQIISLDRRTAKDVMKPRSEMACISDDLSIEEMIEAARKYKHTRLPIYDETPDTIVGILNARTLLLHPDIDLVEAIAFPSFVPESMNLLQLFKSLQRQQRGIAIVLDEFGGTAGVVTMEDILEEVVGEIRSEGEAEDFVIEKIGEGRWRVAGTMRIEDFRCEFAEIGEVENVDTMGGLLMSLLGVVPQTGESAVFRGLRLTARITDERRVRELLVEVERKR
ncbi:MAG: HlyC/CorC family transporter [Verrucomicrobia bacterium]|nr:HlyC/CorC family transporter [Verrucomicrobiota bacterium]